MARTIVGVERAAEGSPLMEPRLWGTWKSDRRKTFEHVHLPKATPEGLKRFRAIFGKMVVKWGRTTFATRFTGKKFLGRFPNDEKPTVERYSILARGPGQVVIVIQERPEIVERSGGLIGSETLAMIEFDGDGYWASSPLMVFKEFFRRVKDVPMKAVRRRK